MCFSLRNNLANDPFYIPTHRVSIPGSTSFIGQMNLKVELGQMGGTDVDECYVTCWAKVLILNSSKGNKIGSKGQQFDLRGPSSPISIIRFNCFNLFNYRLNYLMLYYELYLILSLTNSIRVKDS